MSYTVLGADRQSRRQAQPMWPFRALIFLSLKEKEGHYSHAE